MKLHAKTVGTEKEVREYMAGAAKMLAELAATPNWKAETTAELLEELVDASAELVVLYSRLT